MALRPYSERSEREQVAALRSLVAAKFEGEGRPLVTCRKIAHQHNTTFHAVGRQGEHWFVRLSRTSARTPEQVQAEVSWVQELVGAGLPVARPEPWAGVRWFVASMHRGFRNLVLPCGSVGRGVRSRVAPAKPNGMPSEH